MLTSVSAVEEPSLPSVAAAGTQKVTEEASPERLQEFDNILSHSLPRFRRIAMRWLRNPEDAEDAVQDAMLSAFRHIARFDGRAQMLTWLTAIVINAVRMQLRRRRRHQVLSLDEAPEHSTRSTADLLVDPKRSPEQIVEHCELRELVIKLSDGLPPSQKAALELRRRDDFSVRTAAATLGVPEGTLKAQLARGRAKLVERFHEATATPKTRTTRLNSEARLEATSAGRRRDRAQGLAQLPAAVFGEQGGSEVWVGA